MRLTINHVVAAVITVILLVSTWSKTWLRTNRYANGGLQFHPKTAARLAPNQSYLTRSNSKESKKVLFWYEPYPGKRKSNPMSFNELPLEETDLLVGCDNKYLCEITSNGRTNNTEKLRSYDAIVFHERSWNPLDIPVFRWRNQHYIFLSMESPAWKITDTESMADFFNLTMTYRRDSDIFNPYGWFDAAETTVHLDSSAVLKTYPEKRKMVAWLVSNCKALSGRNEFVKHLGAFVKVDIYGQCGKLRCPRSKTDECRKMLAKSYKFYLALENSLCVDYITEKLFSIMHYNIIPIVFDLHGNVARIAPNHSFINAADFPTVKQLADYLFELDRNETLYNEYFLWKKRYLVRNSPNDLKQGMCRLCSMLHNSSLVNGVKTYKNITNWWASNSKCLSLRFDKSSGWGSYSTIRK